MFLIALRFPERLEGRAEGKASCLKVLFSDGLWLPVPNVSEGHEDAGGDRGAEVAVWVLKARSEVVGVKLNVTDLIIIVYRLVGIQEYFGFCSKVSIGAGVLRGRGAEAERGGWLDR